uniref:SH3 domain-containing protein n=1 Tax=Cyprinus carpio TaxID=7962 RepID=A0A8C2PUX0_CYPCA
CSINSNIKLFARALYDNTAETEDELAFRKGDIVMVLEKNVAGSIGWWKCSLLGRQGLAPANRLAPLSPAEAEKISMTLGTEKDYLNQNIYQTPKATRQPEIPIYEEMSTIYKVPLQAVPAPDKNPCWQRVHRWGPGGFLCRDRYVAQGLYELVKE